MKLKTDDPHAKGALCMKGLQTMRTLVRNMTFLMQSIALGKTKYGLPEKEEWQGMNFIR